MPASPPAGYGLRGCPDLSPNSAGVDCHSGEGQYGPRCELLQWYVGSSLRPLLLFLKEEQLESAATTEGSEAREGLVPVWHCREVGVEIGDRGTGASEADLKMPQTEYSNWLCQVTNSPVRCTPGVQGKRWLETF